MRLTFQELQEMKKKNTIGCKINPLHLTKIQLCEYCGKYFTPTHHRQKFCSDECYVNHRRDYKAKWKREHKHKESLGTSQISGKANKDFNKERRIVRNELRRVKRW